MLDRNTLNTQYIHDLQSTFLQNVQHELSTPVAIILGYADLLCDGELGTLATEQQRAVIAIANRAHELRTLVERITTLLTVEAGEIYSYALNMTDIVDKVICTRQVDVVKARLTLSVDLPADLPSILGDPNQLQHAVDCLVENAIKFTPPDGEIQVKLEENNGWICLHVIDTGIGIAENKLADIFDAFYQVDNSATRQYGGLGLGLTIVRAVVETSGGQIEVESQPDRGSRFITKLPVATYPVDSSQSSESNIESRRILVVDDEKHITWMLREALEGLSNCEIVTAANGEQALQLFEAQPFDLLITDYKMPETDGLTLSARVRELYPQTVIVMLTAYSNVTLLEQAADVSIRYVLNKPVKVSEIRRIASEALDEKTKFLTQTD